MQNTRKDAITVRDPNKIDRRVRYTKKAIRDSFIALLEQKPIEKISVTEICKGADINRGTFYSHYSDPFELRNALANELVEAIERRMTELGVTSLTSLQSFNLLKEHRELLKIFAGPNGDHETIIKIISKQADKYLYETFNNLAKLPEQELSYIRTMLVSSIAITIKHWFDTDFEAEPEVVSSLLENFCSHGTSGFTGEN